MWLFYCLDTLKSIDLYLLLGNIETYNLYLFINVEEPGILDMCLYFDFFKFL